MKGVLLKGIINENNDKEFSIKEKKENEKGKEGKKSHDKIIKRVKINSLKAPIEKIPANLTYIDQE